MSIIIANQSRGCRNTGAIHGITSVEELPDFTGGVNGETETMNYLITVEQMEEDCQEK